MGVREVGIRDFRQHLRRWLDSVRAGDEVVVTERGLPVARVVGAGRKTQLERLLAEGTVTPPSDPSLQSGDVEPVPARKAVSGLVEEQRR